MSDLPAPFSGTAIFRFGFNGCPNVDWTYDTSYVTANGVPVTLHIEVCETQQIPNTNLLVATGSFSITTTSGSIEGSVNGEQTISGPSEFQAVLSPTSGTGVFSSVTGSDTMAVWASATGSAAQGDPGPMTGGFGAPPFG